MYGCVCVRHWCIAFFLTAKSSAIENYRNSERTCVSPVFPRSPKITVRPSCSYSSAARVSPMCTGQWGAAALWSVFLVGPWEWNCLCKWTPACGLREHQRDSRPAPCSPAPPST